MIQMMKKKFKEQQGFTLIELLAVIVILGIITAIAVPSVLKIIDNSKKDAFVFNAQQLVNSAKTAASDNNLSPVGGAIYLSLDFLQKKEYLDVTKDPDGGSFTPGSYTDPEAGSTYDFTTAIDPAGNTSFVKIEIDSTSKKVKYSVQLYGSKRHIDLVDASTLSRSSVTP